MSTTFEKAVSLTLRFEGGYANDSRDPGSETNFGISRRAYPDLDIKNLTEADAKEIYYHDYWVPVGADFLPPPLAMVAFDCAVNSGVARTLSWLSEGADTAVELTARRMEHYISLSKLWPIYSRGWTRRAMGVLKAASKET